MAHVSHVGSVVVGSGVIGTAVARSLARSGHEVLVVERLRQAGQGTTSRNSQAGCAKDCSTSVALLTKLYYPEGSLKARFCSAGAARLYTFAESRHVPHWNCEKLIVAAEGLLDGNMGKSAPARLHIPDRIAGQCWATCFSAILLADKAGGSLEKHRGACKTDKLFTERRDAHIVQQLGSLRLQVRSRSSKSVNVVLAVKDDSVTSTR